MKIASMIDFITSYFQFNLGGILPLLGAYSFPPPLFSLLRGFAPHKRKRKESKGGERAKVIHSLSTFTNFTLKFFNDKFVLSLAEVLETGEKGQTEMFAFSLFYVRIK